MSWCALRFQDLQIRIKATFNFEKVKGSCSRVARVLASSRPDSSGVVQPNHRSLPPAHLFATWRRLIVYNSRHPYGFDTGLETLSG